MIFSLINGLIVQDRYKYLVGQDLIAGTPSPIIGVSLYPLDTKAIKTFWYALNQTKNGQVAFSYAKVENHLPDGNVEVILFYYDENVGRFIFKDIDLYLFENKLERIYLNADFKILSPYK